MYTLHHGDCLDILPMLEAQSIDAVIADIPSGRTACAWDSVIPFEPMWSGIKRVLKPRGACVLMGCTQPFTSALVMSNPAMFKYDWVWEKNKPTGALNVAVQPMKSHESICVFSNGTHVYNPQKIRRTSEEYKACMRTNTTVYGKQSGIYGEHNRNNVRVRPSADEQWYKHPHTVLRFARDEQRDGTLHPTQKPLALLEYLVKTYTNEGDVILDFTFGSGTAGAACGNLGRRFIGIEKDAEYFRLGSERIATAYAPLRAMQGVA
jgi:site-specific DNA-methyltransferase (adenine-specific)